MGKVTTEDSRKFVHSTQVTFYSLLIFLDQMHIDETHASEFIF